jgi:glycoprotein endo-alpha-1,2-mannosidase
MQKIFISTLFVILLQNNATFCQTRHAAESKFMTYKGLVMAGYQGWFNCEGDGADRGWTHYSKNGKFEDGSCTIDYWPEMDEYKVKYKTPFTFR